MEEREFRQEHWPAQAHWYTKLDHMGVIFSFLTLRDIFCSCAPVSKKLAAVCPATDPIDQPAILKWSILMDTQGSVRKLSMSSKKTPKPYYYCPAGAKSMATDLDLQCLK